MKHFFSFLTLSLILVVVVLTAPSCSKYQDGPVISFKKKSKRIANTWKHSAYVYIDINQTVLDNLPSTKYTYTEDGNYYTSEGDTGTWEFSGDIDLKITIKKNGLDSVKQYEILRLATKDFWLKEGDVEIHFSPE
ncbi:MAG: hypothetical protein CVU05_05480 [Bacteroidetes bacterium HGW-Bacteroidetes-21]|jgi:hypothetical protein|nr:MAG: hypothetical protein CVU05_05480 [Bacteroidetes bacterium HGW-Bacteroidetes-21]